MKHPFLCGFLALACLFGAIFVHEFFVGLGHYGDVTVQGSRHPFVTSLRFDPGTGVLEIQAVPNLTTTGRLEVPAQAGELRLGFHYLEPGSLGTLLGLTSCMKLASLEGSALLVERLGVDPPLKLNGGRDPCFSLLELTGFLGALVATPREMTLGIRLETDGQHRNFVFNGASVQERQDP